MIIAKMTNFFESLEINYKSYSYCLDNYKDDIKN